MRMRFNKAEREAYTIGSPVEWRNGRHWHAGVITGPITKDPYAQTRQYVSIRNTARRGTGVPYGEHLEMSPTYVRLPQ